MSLVSLTYLDTRKIAAAHGRDGLATAERERQLALARGARSMVPTVRASYRLLPLGALWSLLRPATT